MSLRYIFIILSVLNFHTVSAQFELELDKFYDGKVNTEANTEFNMITVHTSFETNPIINQITKDFGAFKIVSQEKSGLTLYKWSGIANTKWSKEPIDLFVQSSYMAKMVESIEGKMICHTTNPILTIYSLNQNNEDVLRSSKSASSLKKYFRKLVKTTKKEQKKPVVVYHYVRNAIPEVPNPHSRIIIVSHSLENYEVTNKLIKQFGKYDLGQKTDSKYLTYKWENQLNTKWFDTPFTLVLSVDLENRLGNSLSNIPGGVYTEGKLIDDPKNAICVYLSDKNNNVRVLTDEQVTQIMVDLKKLIQE